MNIKPSILRAIGLLGVSLALCVGCGPMRTDFDAGGPDDVPLAVDTIVTTDVPRIDTPAPMDVPVVDSARRCTGNADCTVGTARLCNLSTGACVQCIPGGATRTCSVGNYCGPMSTCLPGCNSSADCDPGDG